MPKDCKREYLHWNKYFVSDTISSTRYNEYYGFTQQDVDKLLADAEIEEKADLIKEWYDGYNFGEFEVYCHGMS